MHALVLQCGGPTAVVNASLAAIVRGWRTRPGHGTLYGGRYGLAALLTGEWTPLAAAVPAAGGKIVPVGCDDDRSRGTAGPPVGRAAPGSTGSELGSDAWLSAIAASPGMALGGGRDRLSEQDFDRAVHRLAAASVGTVFLIGGNGTMAACRALSARAALAGVRLRVVGVPKTIDNDIPGMDVCPGFLSAARFLVEAVRDVAADVSSMRGYEDVVLIEAMGRHSGWLAAATLAARSGPGDAPHLVLVPEQPVDVDALLDAIGRVHAREGVCVVTVAEGVRDPAGVLLAERSADREVERDASGQVILGRSGGPLPYLATLVRERLGLKCRLVRPDVLQRCSRAHVRPPDLTIAAMVGDAAVRVAPEVEPDTPVMLAVRQQAGDWTTNVVPLAEVRGERQLPLSLLADPAPMRSWLEEAHPSISDARLPTFEAPDSSSRLDGP